MAAAVAARAGWGARARPAAVAGAAADGSSPLPPPGARRRARARTEKEKRQQQQVVVPPTPTTTDTDNDRWGDLGCPHALSGRCSGCSLTGRRDIASPPSAAEAEAFFAPLLLLPRDSSGPPPAFSVLAGPTRGWRCRARLAVRWAAADDRPGQGRRRRLALGLFRRGSHAIGPDLTGAEPGSVACPVHHPLLNEALALVKRVAEELGVEPYEEDEEEREERARARARARRPPPKGTLRYVQATVVAAGASPSSPLGVQLVLVVNAPKGSDDAPADAEDAAARRASVAALAAELRRRGARGDGRPLLHSVRVNCQPRADSNAVLGPDWLEEEEEEEEEEEGEGGAALGWVALGPPPEWASASSPAWPPALPRWSAWAAAAPGGFTQANQGAMRAAAAAVAEAALAPLASAAAAASSSQGRPVRAVVDLFAGSGALGLAVAAAAAAAAAEAEATRPRDLSVACVEVNARCAPAFAAAREALPSPLARAMLAPELRVADCSGGRDLAEQLFLLPPSSDSKNDRQRVAADVVIVDPPRKGLGPEMVAALTARRTALLPRRLVYLSCGWRALRGDAAALLGLDEGDGAAAGERVRWTLRSARAFVFFPGTDAIETLCVFEREGDD